MYCPGKWSKTTHHIRLDEALGSTSASLSDFRAVRFGLKPAALLLSNETLSVAY